MRWFLRNLASLFPRRRVAAYDPFRYGSEPHTSPWDLVTGDDELRAILDSGEIKKGGLPRAD